MGILNRQTRLNAFENAARDFKANTELWNSNSVRDVRAQHSDEQDSPPNKSRYHSPTDAHSCGVSERSPPSVFR